jgi:predicted nucleic acid-binding protein
MTSSFSQKVERGLDAMLIVYSLIDGHPASTVCEQFIRNQTGWFTTTFTLFEVKGILTKVYGVDAIYSSQLLAQLTSGPIIVRAVDLTTALAAISTADTHGIDLTDALLLQTAQKQGVSRLATDDGKLIKVCHKLGITPENPIDSAIRQQIATWETANLPVKGLPRVLRQIHQWLSQHDPQTAQDFWSQTGGGSHLP